MSNKINTALVYFTTFVLLSTLVITPISISNSYWRFAYAEEQLIDEFTFEINNFNATSIELVNATSTEIIQTNSIDTEPIPINATSTEIMSAYDMQTLQVIEKDGAILSEPVLLYASNTQNEFKFQVTAPNGQCVIGTGDECSVKDSTRSNRGRLSSVQYGEQTLRIKYSGPDSTLERFSITLIDSIIGDWTITLETEEGLIPQAQAVKDLSIKVKHKIHSKTIIVYSD